ncbi:ImmA/IrrE family metallo-endopeptidase [Anaerotignum sp. MB30-C6]|uniref:ImmA/IrrE family metallo-endopeptidase n=1 Tax=Anaerotignum sp. MB30-C6 TaxID=3070814 RepID=UPI0027DD7213|nr:ImmA/IrrE family metallo-endopeptidase [Anaerotignum sp. MB30-C6]WMI81895.1 ImmA/IrrE family metallo-endopeptidase [Anaerotignum sp. MB30-C6]
MKSIKQTADYYKRKFGTSNPFEIAEFLNIEVILDSFDKCSGCYLFIKNHRCIFINKNLEHKDKMLVMAHELGHALLHRKQNCYFIRNKTHLLSSRIEREANRFAVCLLIEDSELEEYKDRTISELASIFGLEPELVELRMR